MKWLMRIISVFIILIGLAMMVFAWFFFFTEEEAMVVLASLYVSLLVSALVITIGTFVLLNHSKEGKK